jgi:hypothetical protein
VARDAQVLEAVAALVAVGRGASDRGATQVAHELGLLWHALVDARKGVGLVVDHHHHAQLVQLGLVHVCP